MAPCAVCGGRIAASATGRPATVCSETCRRKRRAEQARARRVLPRLRVVAEGEHVPSVNTVIEVGDEGRAIERACVAVVLRAVHGGDVRAARWVLERRFARRWGRRERR